MIFHLILNGDQMTALAATLATQLEAMAAACALASAACDSRAVREIVARMTELQALEDELQLALDRGVAEAKAQEQIAAYRVAAAAKQNGTGN